MLKRFAVDFNTMAMDPHERVYLARADRHDATGAALASVLPGERVLLSDGTMEVEATVESETFHSEHRAWLGRPAWATRRDRLPIDFAKARVDGSGRIRLGPALLPSWLDGDLNRSADEIHMVYRARHVVFIGASV